MEVPDFLHPILKIGETKDLLDQKSFYRGKLRFLQYYLDDLMLAIMVLDFKTNVDMGGAAKPEGFDKYRAAIEDTLRIKGIDVRRIEKKYTFKLAKYDLLRDFFVVVMNEIAVLLSKRGKIDAFTREMMGKFDFHLSYLAKKIEKQQADFDSILELTKRYMEENVEGLYLELVVPRSGADFEKGDDSAVWHVKKIEEPIGLSDSKKKGDFKVLDLGCGDGFWSNGLLRSGYDVTGVDVKKDTPRFLSRTPPGHFYLWWGGITDDMLKRFHYHSFNLTEIGQHVGNKKDLKPKEFDIVLLMRVLQHIPNIGGVKKLLENISIATKDNAVLVIEFFSDLYFFDLSIFGKETNSSNLCKTKILRAEANFRKKVREILVSLGWKVSYRGKKTKDIATAPHHLVWICKKAL